MTEKRECFVSIATLKKTYQIQMGQVVRAKVRALNDLGWGEYGPPNSDGFKMQSEPSQAVGLTNGTVT
jgi:hypothetical protein